ncbi:MAG: ABC transporter ATP-binding protein [Clostridium sp.]|uniref:ABC transporter ATP-binding protein n=1 Tax=Clostridium sp. TaxID=1506 RepID=UPI003D6D71BA
MDRNEVLSIKDLYKTFTSKHSKVEALKGISLSLYKGEMLAIMGSSGSGKSTLLNVIGALDSPTEGKIFIDNKEIKDYHLEPYATKYRSENIGFIFQSFHLLKDLTVEENIALPLILKGESKEVVSELTQKQLELIGLHRWRKHRPIELSGGQQQRVAIARALITVPPVLLADEPTGNLDYNTSMEILEIIVQAKKRLNQSIIIVTHDPMVASYADRILFFHDGKIVDQYNKNNEKGDINIILDKFKKILEVRE